MWTTASTASRRRKYQRQLVSDSYAMGNEESTVVDESTHPSVLGARNLQAVAQYIKEHDVKRIVVMVCT